MLGYPVGLVGESRELMHDQLGLEALGHPEEGGRVVDVAADGHGALAREGVGLVGGAGHPGHLVAGFDEEGD